MKLRPDPCTKGDTLHGGAVLAFVGTLDALGTFTKLPSGARTATIESRSRFISAARLGSAVTRKSDAFHRVRTTTVRQTSIRTEAGKRCAVVAQTQRVIPG